LYKFQIGKVIQRESIEVGGNTVKIWVDFNSLKFETKIQALRFWFGEESKFWSDKMVLIQYNHIPFKNNKIVKI